MNWDCALALNADRRRNGVLQALPDVRRVVLDGGHLPWVEEPAAFRAAVAGFLTGDYVARPPAPQ